MKEQCNKVKRTSYFNSNRGSYLDEERQEYVYEVLTYDENDRPIPSQVRVAVTKDNTEIIKYLDEQDHKEDLQERYQKENSICSINQDVSFDDGKTFENSVLNKITDPNSDIYKILFDDEPKNKKKSRINEFYKTLKPIDIELIQEHIFNHKTISQVAKELKQNENALESRFRRIRQKASEFYCIELPKRKNDGKQV